VGVLAVSAVLAGLLVPKIFASLNEARINDTVTAYNAIQSAATTYFSKYGKFGGIEGATYASGTSVTNWDSAVLLVERLIDKAFLPRLTDLANVVVSDCSASTTDASGTNNAYDLDGNTDYNKNDAFGAKVVECVLYNVTREDAWELSRRIDGPSLSASAKTDAQDLKGRVKYDMGTGATGTVRIYVAHK
jgi:type II secretory pathway pseudopilin PulG